MTKIIIIDDETNLREMLNLMIHKEGYETAMTEDDEDFLSKIDEVQPSLVTLDVMMPGLTTLEILDKLKEKNQTKNNSPNSRTILRRKIQKLYKMGIVDYVTKPFDLDELIIKIHRHLDK